MLCHVFFESSLIVEKLGTASHKAYHIHPKCDQIYVFLRDDTGRKLNQLLDAALIL